MVVGVNGYRLEQEEPIPEIDNSTVRAAQIKRLKNIMKTRDSRKLDAILATMTHIARSSEGNLLEGALEAARARATIGEMSDAMRQAFGDHEAVPDLVSDVYGPAYWMIPNSPTSSRG